MILILINLLMCYLDWGELFCKFCVCIFIWLGCFLVKRWFIFMINYIFLVLCSFCDYKLFYLGYKLVISDVRRDNVNGMCGIFFKWILI